MDKLTNFDIKKEVKNCFKFYNFYKKQLKNLESEIEIKATDYSKVQVRSGSYSDIQNKWCVNIDSRSLLEKKCRVVEKTKEFFETYLKLGIGNSQLFVNILNNLLIVSKYNQYPYNELHISETLYYRYKNRILDIASGFYINEFVKVNAHVS